MINESRIAVRATQERMKNKNKKRILDILARINNSYKAV